MNFKNFSEIVKVEFDLKVKKYAYKNEMYTQRSPEDEPDVVEELNFKSLSPIECIRRLIDYL